MSGLGVRHPQPRARCSTQPPFPSPLKRDETTPLWEIRSALALLFLARRLRRELLPFRGRHLPHHQIAAVDLLLDLLQLRLALLVLPFLGRLHNYMFPVPPDDHADP